MDAQSLIAFGIVLAACIYVGSMLKRRTRSFTKKPGCASDCGCSGTEAKEPKLPVG